MEKLIFERRLFAPKEVLYELEKQKDDLSEWSKKQKKLFINPNQTQIKIIKKNLEKFPQLIKTNGEYDADPWIIALAKEIKQSKQGTWSLLFTFFSFSIQSAPLSCIVPAMKIINMCSVIYRM